MVRCIRPIPIINYQFQLSIFYSLASSSITPVMRKVTIPGISNDVCKQSFPLIVTDATLCCDSTGGKGSCNVKFFIFIFTTVLRIDKLRYLYLGRLWWSVEFHSSRWHFQSSRDRQFWLGSRMRSW